jgi:hypothetical protein
LEAQRAVHSNVILDVCVGQAPCTLVAKPLSPKPTALLANLLTSSFSWTEMRPFAFQERLAGNENARDRLSSDCPRRRNDDEPWLPDIFYMFFTTTRAWRMSRKRTAENIVAPIATA